MTDSSAPSPTASNASGTTTNPNTPRPEHEHEDPLEGDQAQGNSPRPAQGESIARDEADDISSLSPSSDASRQRTHDIQPTWPRKLDQTKTRALACWQSSCNLEDIFLDIHWTRRGNTGSAFFKLHTSLCLEGAPSSRRDGRVSAYVFIYPERVRRLSLDAQPQTMHFGADTVALTFDMSKPSALVLPKTYSRVKPEAEETMKSLRALARQLSFTVYAALPRRKFPVAWMQQLCSAATYQRLSTIASCANLVNLYQGRGAQMLEGNDLLEPDADGNSDIAHSNPPAYEDSGPRPPSTLPTKGKKRRRSSSTSTAEAASKHMNRAAVEALLDARLDVRLDARLTAHKMEVAEMHAVHKAEVVELLSAHKVGIVKLITALKTEFADRLDDSETKVKEGVVDGLAEYITEQVQEEMGGVEDRVMDKITSMRLQASLTFPEHPIY